MTYENRNRTRWEPESTRVPDPMCKDCGTWHLRDRHTVAGTARKEIAAWSDEFRVVVKAELLRELEDRVRALPTEGIRHIGPFVERAAVLALITTIVGRAGDSE